MRAYYLESFLDRFQWFFESALPICRTYFIKKIEKKTNKIPAGLGGFAKKGTLLSKLDLDDFQRPRIPPQK
jgi:hypothetical protein